MPSDHIRLLVCFECKTMEELVDYPPDADPKYDVVLHEVDYKHGGQLDDAEVRSHRRELLRMEKRFWSAPAFKRDVTKRIWANETGFTPEYYHAKNTLLEDAGKCFRDHHQPDLCPDWHSDNKRIGNPAARERQQLARELKDENLAHTRVKVFLCDFCVVASKVMQKRREDAGMYT